MSYGQQTVGVFLNDSLSENGYTLFTVRNNTYLIDNCGFLINSWESEFSPGLSVYLLDNGNLLRTARVPGSFNGGGIGGRFELYNWEGDLLWSYNYANSDYHHHHDIAPMPNGNILLIAWEKISYMEAVTSGRDPNETPTAGVWPDKVVEIEMVGSDDANIVWEWRMWDHLIQDFDSSKENYGVVADHPELLDVNYEAYANTGPGDSGSDWMHCNAIDYHPDLDQIVLSSRHLDEIWIIDHSTTTEEAAGHTGGNSGKGGDILYRYGNPVAYDHGVVIDQKFFGQHDVKWIPEGYPNAGKISVFNNGQGRQGGNYSSIDVIDPPVDAAGNYTYETGVAYGPEELFWTYEADPPESFYSSNISGAHFLPNGSVLVCDGNAPLFFEVDLDGEIHWEYVNPVLNNGSPVTQGSSQQTADVFRATRYPLNYSAFTGKDLTPGDPIENNPFGYDCQIYDGISSTSDLQLAEAGFQLFPNPVSTILNISWEGNEPIELFIHDLLGQVVEQQTVSPGSSQLDLSDWANGVYLLNINGLGVKRIIVAK